MAKRSKPAPQAKSIDEVATYEDERYAFSRGGPKRKVPAAEDALAGIVETLYSEHGYIESLLQTLEEQAQRLKPGKIPDYQLLLDIVDYLVNYPDRFHHPREDLLFNKLLEQDKKFAPRMERLEREHETLRFYNDQLFQELTRIVDGAPVNRPELMRSVDRYVDGYRKHMAYESKHIFPRAKGTLTADDLYKLNSRTRYIDDPLFGPEVQYQYRRLGRQVQTRVGMVSGEIIAREFSAIEATIGRLSTAVDRLGRLGDSIKQQSRDSWREQLDTVKRHSCFGKGPNIVFLPFALFNNHRRHLREGFDQVRAILDGSDAGESAGTR